MTEKMLLAAVDDSAAAGPVLAAANHLAALAGAEVLALHVQNKTPGSTARLAAEAAAVRLLLRRGDVVAEIAAAIRELEPEGLVVGARAVPGGALPAGHVALELAQHLPLPVFVIPPDAVPAPIQRVLVAVEGDGERETLLAVAEQVHDPEIVALHVFPPLRLPPFSDNPVLETDAWAQEFLRRLHEAPTGRLHLELRVGDPAAEVSAAVEELGVDLVALLWHRDISHGHGRVVRRVLETASVPVLLLPMAMPVAAETAAKRSAT